MEDKKYFFHPDKKFLKQGFLMEDENNNVVYEVKVLKQPIFGAGTFEFINHISKKDEEHKVGHVVTVEQENGEITDVLSTKSYFKYDGKNIWDYLHEMGIRINSNLLGGKLGMSYTVSLEGKNIATLNTSSPKGKSIITTRFYYDIITTEEYLDIVFLTTFAIARTEQIFYN